MKIRLNIGLTLVLLGLLLSYKLDVECILGGRQCRQMCQQSATDMCADPSYGSHYEVALPVRPSVLQPYIVERPEWLPPVSSELPPSGPGITILTRLRAPPGMS